LNGGSDVAVTMRTEGKRRSEGTEILRKGGGKRTLRAGEEGRKKRNLKKKGGRYPRI